MADKFLKEFEEFLVMETDVTKCISTGAPSLDWSIGIGGIPRGRITEIYGVESSGKTTLCLSIVKHALKEGLKVIYVDIEYGLDFQYIKDIVGEVGDNFRLYQPETAEQAMVLVDSAVRSGEYGLVILDSIGALSPKKEKEDELADANVALVSKLLTKFARRIGFAVHHSETALVLINQVRDKIGAYVPMLDTPGGHTLKHYYSLRIALSKAKEIKQGDEVVGINAKFVIKKNKLAAPLKTFEIPIMFGKGIDTFRDLVMFSEFVGVVERKGSWMTFNGINLGQGVVKTMQFLENNKEVLDKIIIELYNITNSVHEIMKSGEEIADEEDSDTA
jgi:recombination protein RecA